MVTVRLRLTVVMMLVSWTISVRVQVIGPTLAGMDLEVNNVVFVMMMRHELEPLR
jgi:hypothetical protein